MNPHGFLQVFSEKRDLGASKKQRSFNKHLLQRTLFLRVQEFRTP